MAKQNKPEYHIDNLLARLQTEDIHWVIAPKSMQEQARDYTENFSAVYTALVKDWKSRCLDLAEGMTVRAGIDKCKTKEVVNDWMATIIEYHKGNEERHLLLFSAPGNLNSAFIYGLFPEEDLHQVDEERRAVCEKVRAFYPSVEKKMSQMPS